MAISDKFAHRVPLSRSTLVEMEWGGYNDTFLINLDSSPIYGGAMSTANAGNKGQNKRRLTVVFVARILRVIYQDPENGSVVNPQRILFRVFRQADLHALRTLVYGNYQPPIRTFHTHFRCVLLIRLRQVRRGRRSTRDAIAP